MIRLSLPVTHDEVLGFMKIVVHEVNLSGHQAARIDADSNVVIVTSAKLQNTDDNEEFEAVFRIETLTGEELVWAERLSSIRFDRSSPSMDLRLFDSANCSLILIGL